MNYRLPITKKIGGIKMEKNIVKVLLNPVGKHRPNAINHRITIPADIARELNITKDNRTFDIKVEGKKIILEMVGK